MSPEQLKGKIKNFSIQSGLATQEILQMFLFERILERLSKSKYSKKFILKGGLLISSMIGIAQRTTMDMDATVTGVNMDLQTIEKIVKEIIAQDVDDQIVFEFKRIEHIRENDEYFNFRVHFNAIFGKINNPMKLDITTGDAITPGAVEYSFKKLFDGQPISVMAYNIETVIAEKYETIIRRNISNTRARDYYDLYKFWNLYKDKINIAHLKSAVNNTAKQRNSLSDLQDTIEIIEDIKEDKYQLGLWENYCKLNTYASGIIFNDVVDVVTDIAKILI